MHRKIPITEIQIPVVKGLILEVWNSCNPQVYWTFYNFLGSLENIAEKPISGLTLGLTRGK